MPEKRIFAKAGHVCMMCGFKATTKKNWQESKQELRFERSIPAQDESVMSRVFNVHRPETNREPHQTQNTKC